MKHASRVCLFLAALVGAVACAKNPRSVAITEQNREKLLEELKDVRGLTVGETRAVLAYQLRHALGGGQAIPKEMVGKTLGNLIDEQLKWEADEKTRAAEADRLAKEAKAARDKKMAVLRDTLTVALLDKGFAKVNYQEFITIAFAFENKSQKDIRAFEGTVGFTDLFGKPIFQSSITFSTPVKAGHKATWDGSVRYNQFKEDHVALNAANTGDLKLTWEPNQILFADSSTLSAADAADATR